ncbi:hypothetical protein K439DRAFT_1112762 [Ramaria rubella]|nr:hypothetical protein K439DRAFT_1112762 [Ramaria rubella]
MSESPETLPRLCPLLARRSHCFLPESIEPRPNADDFAWSKSVSIVRTKSHTVKPFFQEGLFKSPFGTGKTNVARLGALSQWSRIHCCKHNSNPLVQKPIIVILAHHDCAVFK